MPFTNSFTHLPTYPLTHLPISPVSLPDPLWLTTAIEAVVRAGDLQMASFGGTLRVDKKGAIDLVTEVDVAVERMLRGLIAERFPDHSVLAEELQAPEAAASRHCW